MRKYSKGKECRGFVYKKHTSAQAYMIPLTFAYILYSLYIVCMYKKHTKVVSVSLLYKFCIVYTLFVCTKNIQKLFQLGSCISFVQFVQCLYVQKTYISSFKPFMTELCTSFVHFVHFLYMCRNLMQVFCIFIII